MCQICENQGKAFEFITNVDEDVNLVSHSNCNFTLTRFLNLYSRRVRWNRVSINLDRNVLSWKRSVKKSRIRANNIDNFASRKIIHDELSAEDEVHLFLSLSLSLSSPFLLLLLVIFFLSNYMTDTRKKPRRIEKKYHSPIRSTNDRYNVMKWGLVVSVVHQNSPQSSYDHLHFLPASHFLRAYLDQCWNRNEAASMSNRPLPRST